MTAGSDRNAGKTRGGFHFVMAGLVPAIPIIRALCSPDRDRRDKPGDDKSATTATSDHHFTSARPAMAFAASAFNRSMMSVVEESGSRSTSTTLPPYDSTNS